MDGSIEDAEFKQLPFFDLAIPQSLPNCDTGIMNPQDTYENTAEWEEKAKKLASMFVDNFTRFTDNDEGKALVAAGPTV